MGRLYLKLAVITAVLGGPAAFAAGAAEPPPFPLRYELKPAPPSPAKFSTLPINNLSRLATFRKIAAGGSLFLFETLLVVCYFSLLRPGRVSRRDNRRWSTFVLTALPAAAAAAISSGAYGVATAIAAAAYGVPVAVGDEGGRLLIATSAAFAAAFGIASFRTRWPRAWWVLFALVTALAIAAITVIPPGGGRPLRTGLLTDASSRLTARAGYPAAEVRIYDYLPGRGPLSAAYYPEAGVFAVGPRAANLDVYEAEYMFAWAVERALGLRRSLFFAAVILATTLSLAASDMAAAAVGRRRRIRPSAPSNALMVLGVLVFVTACWMPFFKTWKRGMELAATEKAIMKTLLPAAGASLTLKEVLENKETYRPPHILHIICDDHPSPAERAARVYAAWDRLM